MEFRRLIFRIFWRLSKLNRYVGDLATPIHIAHGDVENLLQTFCSSIGIHIVILVDVMFRKQIGKKTHTHTHTHTIWEFLMHHSGSGFVGGKSHV